jgi:PilX N-terminal
MEEAKLKMGSGMTTKYALSLSPAAGIRNERGVALVIALVMLVLLTILGAWALNTSSTNLRIAGNYSKQMNAFYAAEAGVAYSASDSNLKAVCASVDCSSNPTGTTRKTPPGPPPSITIGTNTAQVQTEFLFVGDPPLGSKWDMDNSVDKKGKGLYFLVNSTGYGPNNSQVSIEAEVVQIAN